ncbi:transmembrane protease serine 9 [Rhipicephalus sanguineus]|uniref:transmembrane protease serine 9 n=1 Tax=Rhipicephalus sanguineus TaxID=34632 RepID=UPI0018931D27|nr:transmembrane protease serine 9 [Rhipicephalus sanguineus]
MELLAAADCGVAARPPPANESRIVGGTPTDIDQWPWQVSLHHRRPSSGAPGRRLCAASLVSASWLLTAAHCLLDPAAAEGTGRLLPAGLWLACRAGQCVRLRKLAVHAGFRRHNYTHDVALAELVQPLPAPARPICLPTSSSGGSAAVGRRCVITGWGARRPLVSRATKLQQASLPVLPWDLCRRAYPWAAALRRWLLCAGLWKGGRGPCHGDSGGPLQCQRSDGRWQLSGLVSWGAGCGRPGRPAVFVRVVAYRRWIRDAIKRLQHRNQATPRDKDRRQQVAARDNVTASNLHFSALSFHAFML